jgi:pimeloyl-ACP methyl ester carboxylesterase
MGVVASSADGSPVAFEVRGSGDPTLVFIHGLSGDRSDFDPQMSYFEDSFRVVAVDLPGSGDSGRVRTSWTMAAFGEDVVSVADRLDLNDMVLVGHSLGGDVTVEAALRLEGRVRGLVWASSYKSLGVPMSAEQLEEWLAPFRTDFVSAAEDLARRNFGPQAPSGLVERVAAKVSAADPDTVIAVLLAKQRNEPAVLEALRKITVPVTAINPDFKPIDAASFDAHGVEHKVMAGVGHFLMMEDPNAFNHLLADTIKTFTAPH